jgi:serine/threonine protein kinase
LKHPSQYEALTTDLRAQLQSAVGATYTLERELGGGGMSRVWLATELASGVSTDRFRQEIRLAARLQHPHIVSLRSTGEADGLLFYTMPLIDPIDDYHFVVDVWRHADHELQGYVTEARTAIARLTAERS